MTEAVSTDKSPHTVLSPGQLLREAREAKGLHVAALAGSIRVPARKLELLEADQWEALPDMAFARALALTVCRSLGVDSGPIVSGLPQAQIHRIEQVAEGLNTPFRERSIGSGYGWSWFAHPLTWLAVLVLLAAGLLHQLPGYWPDLSERMQRSQRNHEALGESPSGVATASGGAVEHVETVMIEPSTPPAANVAAPDPLADLLASLESKPVSSQPLELRVKAPSWIEVQDASGKIVFSRILHPGPEPVAVGGVEPFRLKIGNAFATEVKYRGRAVDLTASTRDNVARLDLN